MSRRFTFLIGLAVVICCTYQTGGQTRSEDDEKRQQILNAISETSLEGLKIIAKAQDTKPEINGHLSTKPLIEIVQDYAHNKGAYSIKSIGWEAVQKKNGRWKIIFHFQTYAKDFVAAEWEYNEEGNKLYPFEHKMAPTFWSGEKQH